MKMSFRWFGSDDDSVSLAHVRQIPGVEVIVGALFHIPVGEVWPLKDIMKLKKEITDHGFSFEVVESVNVHESIKSIAGAGQIYRKLSNDHPPFGGSRRQGDLLQLYAGV